jgi:hypothetical protein
MSEPRKDYKNMLRGAFEELQSVSSSLHMYPEPLEDPGPDALPYLDETDKWVHHATEHLQMAKDIIREYEVSVQEACWLLRKIEIEMEFAGKEEALISMGRIEKIREMLKGRRES